MTGDRVRVVLEGETERPTGGGTGFFMGSTRNWIDPSAEHVISVEVLPPPEPEWAPGDVGRCEHNHTYLRTMDGEWVNMRGEVSGNTTCPRTPLVLNGRTVSP